MNEGAVDPLNGWHFNDAVYLTPQRGATSILVAQCSSHEAERRVYLSCVVLSSFAYNINSFRYIGLIFAPLCRYWNELYVHVDIFSPPQYFQLLFTTDLCYVIFWNSYGLIVDRQPVSCNFLEKRHYNNIEMFI
jgi:hypothetical protein